MSAEAFALRTHEEMKPVLAYPDASGPAAHYYMIRGGSAKGNVTVWEAGSVDGEYIKSFGHYHVDQLPEVYRVLAGEGIALLQKRKGGKQDELEHFLAIPFKSGDRLDIPVGYGHLLVNTGPSFLVTVDDSPVAGVGDSASMPLHADYEPVRAMRGFAYYVIEHDGAPALVKNRLYKAIEKEDLANIKILDRFE